MVAPDLSGASHVPVHGLDHALHSRGTSVLRSQGLHSRRTTPQRDMRQHNSCGQRRVQQESPGKTGSQVFEISTLFY